MTTEGALALTFPSPGEMLGPRPEFAKVSGAAIMAWTHPVFGTQCYYHVDERPPGLDVTPLYDRPGDDPLLANPVIHMGQWGDSWVFSKEPREGWMPLYWH